MIHLFVLVAGGLICVALGAVVQATFGKDEAATKEELAAWAQRARAAFDGDLTKAKASIKAIAVEIESKL